MKTKPTLKFAILLCAFIPGAVFAQPSYVFQNSTIHSGVALQQGAVYKFADVYANTDAFITIVGFSNGMTITTFDADNTGYRDAFQPVISCPTNIKSYVEFRVDFVEHSNNSISKVMTEVPMTGLDIDGFTFPSGKICEFNQFKTNSSYYVGYNMSGGLTTTLNSNWYEALNQPATFYPGIDTAAKDVMFSLVTASVSSVSFRIGTDNKSTTHDSRQSSVYFKKFSFQNIVLSSPKLNSFTGIAESPAVKLEWNFLSLEHVKSVTLEKAIHPNQYHAINEIKISDHNKNSFSYTDNTSGAEKVYYRLAITSVDGKVSYSNILPFQLKSATSSFAVFPAAFNNILTLNIRSEKKAQGSFSIVDYTGNIVHQKSVKLYAGTNNISVNAGDKLPAGNYIAVLETGGSKSTQKIVKL